MSDIAIATSPTPADQVFTWILSGDADYEILAKIATTWPEAKAKTLVVEAMKRIEESGTAENDTLRGWCIEASRFVYQKALAIEDFSTALRAIKQIHSLIG